MKHMKKMGGINAINELLWNLRVCRIWSDTFGTRWTTHVQETILDWIMNSQHNPEPSTKKDSKTLQTDGFNDLC